MQVLAACVNLRTVIWRVLSKRLGWKSSGEHMKMKPFGDFPTNGRSPTGATWVCLRSPLKPKERIDGRMAHFYMDGATLTKSCTTMVKDKEIVQS